ncbi:hypothetical protein, partial [Streptomyces sp. NPDC085529]|uniref:hypothetical protein n=1 Tax=Streptomyces sp. NPDC085529 TaxID=3365729 RepID=UPI0037D71745
ALPSFPTLSDLSDPISSVLSGPDLFFSGPSGAFRLYQNHFRLPNRQLFVIRDKESGVSQTLVDCCRAVQLQATI